MTIPTQLFDAIERLANDPSFLPEDVVRVTGHALKACPEDSTMYFLTLRSEPHTTGLFRTIELRHPMAASGKHIGLLFLELRPGLSIARADVLARYGPEPNVLLPLPEAPDPPGSYSLQYWLGWGYLRFVFDPNGLVTNVILDPLEEAPKEPPLEDSELSEDADVP